MFGSTGIVGSGSPTARAIRRFARHRLAIAAVAVLSVFALLGLLAPIISPHDPLEVDLSEFRSPPSATHLLGTDSAGRDVLSRLLYGARISLVVGASAGFSAALIGLAVGLLAGGIGRWVDSVAMRVVDVFLSFPAFVLILLLVAAWGQGLFTIIVALALLEWPIAARLVRNKTLSLRELDFVKASRSMDGSPWWIMSRHLAPSVLGTVTVVAALVAGRAILIEAALSFIGLGIPSPAPSWGTMLNEALSLTVLEQMPWLWLPPGLAISVTILSINLFDDGLQDALNPRSSRRQS